MKAGATIVAPAFLFHPRSSRQLHDRAIRHGLYLAGPVGMDVAAAHTLYNALAGDRSSFLYSGSFPDDHTARLIALSEGFFSDQPVRRGQGGRLAFVMVEAYQNILRHRAPEAGATGKSGRSMFALRFSNDRQDVLTANPVKREDVPALRELLSKIEGLDKSQLKDLFLRGLQSQPSGRRGAGLGLIEMARRSGNDLLYTLTPLPGGGELFALRVRLGEQDGTDDTTGRMLQALIDELDILLLHRGAAPASVQETFLRIAEVETGGHHSPVGRIYLAAMEHLAECPHRSNNAMVMVVAGKDGYSLVIAHALTREERVDFEAQLEEVRSLDLPSLSSKYREGLLRRARGEEVRGLGLLDLARHASGRLEYVAMGGGDDTRFTLITARC